MEAQIIQLNSQIEEAKEGREESVAIPLNEVGRENHSYARIF